MSARNRIVLSITLSLSLVIAASSVLAAEDASVAPLDYEAAIAADVDAGMPIDQSVTNLLRDNPQAIAEIEKAAYSLLKTMPYGGTCDDCGCSGTSALVEYPISELESLPPENWIQEVVDRYRSKGEELILPSLTINAQFPFFYHLIAPLEQIRPYLLGDSEPTEDAINQMLAKLSSTGISEPVRLVLTSLGEGPGVLDGKALVAAAERKGLTELPVRFSFTECSICNNRSDSSHYSVPEMRDNGNLVWAAQRFFDDAEFVRVDKRYPHDGYDFDYHMKPSIEELLAQFEGEPDAELKKEWLAKLKSKQGLQPVPVSMNYVEREIEVGDPVFPPKSVHAMLAAARDLGMQSYPVLNSFEDQIACRSNGRRITFSANELFPDNRLALVSQRYFTQRKRLVFDEAGRNREEREGYPFGGLYPYHMMAQVDELYSYIKEEDLPAADEVAEKAREIQEKGVPDPVYLELMRGSKEQGFSKDSLVLIAAAKSLGMEKLPVRLLYMENSRRDRKVCEWLIRRAIEQYRLAPIEGDKDKPAGSGPSILTPSQISPS